MAQKILFASFPNTPPAEFYQNMILLYGEIKRSSPSQKNLREFLRMSNKFDKDTFPILMEFLDVIMEEPVRLGPFAEKVFEAEDETQARPLIATRLVDQNPLLAKYCLEAMDMEHGGRLHSTNELYKMITSYVYPGLKPTLTSFKAWVDWAVCAGLLKMIGIRWALGPVSDRVMPRLRAIDAEEFLEEERLQKEMARAEKEEETMAKPAPELSKPVNEPKMELPKSPPEPQLAPQKIDQPSVIEQESISQQTPQPPQAYEPPSGVVRVLKLPVISPADKLFFKPSRVVEDDLKKDSDYLKIWYEQYPDKRPFSLIEMGIDPKNRTPSFYLETGFASLLLSRGLTSFEIREALELFKSQNILLSLSKGRFPLDLVSDLLTRIESPALLTALELSVHLPRLLKGTMEPTAFTKAENSRDLLERLWKSLYSPTHMLAPFFFARSLFEANLIGENLYSACVLPSRTVRENAFRIGFIQTMYADNFFDLMQISERIAGYFGAPYFEAPLSQVHEAFGCAFRCQRISSCPLACREKGEGI